ncbi:MAG: hypothetical protein LJE87_06705 [Deltaproteobacteria bacterium]|nr:hypothetical protein [Deltaproteobacteria bacterium]
MEKYSWQRAGGSRQRAEDRSQRSEVRRQRLCCGSGFPAAILGLEQLQRFQRFTAYRLLLTIYRSAFTM